MTAVGNRNFKRYSVRYRNRVSFQCFFFLQNRVADPTFHFDPGPDTNPSLSAGYWAHKTSYRLPIQLKILF